MWTQIWSGFTRPSRTRSLHRKCQSSQQESTSKRTYGGSKKYHKMSKTPWWKCRSRKSIRWTWTLTFAARLPNKRRRAQRQIITWFTQEADRQTDCLKSNCRKLQSQSTTSKQKMTRWWTLNSSVIVNQSLSYQGMIQISNPSWTRTLERCSRDLWVNRSRFLQQPRGASITKIFLSTALNWSKNAQTTPASNDATPCLKQVS